MKKLIELYFSSLQRTLLFWLLVVSILPFVSVAWYGYAQTAQSVDAMQRNKLTERATLNVATLSDHFYETVRNLKSWSGLRTSLEIVVVLGKSFNQSGQSLADFVRSAKYNEILKIQPKIIEQNLAKNYNYVYDLLLIDLDGNILYSVAHESDFGTNLQNGPYSRTRFAQAYRMSLADEKAHFSDLERYAPSGGIVTGFITQPVFDTSGKMVGIMALQLKMDVLFGSMQARSKAIHQYLVGVDGLLRTPIKEQSDVLVRRVTTKAFWNWYKEHAIDQNDSDTMTEAARFYTGPNGSTVLGEYRSIDLLGVRWAHISEMDKGEALAQSNKLLLTVSIFTLIVIFTVVFAAVIIARRIVKPISALSSASQEYMSGVKGVQVSLDVINEIGKFGSVFNALIQKQEYDEEQLKYLAQKAQKTLDELREQKYALDAHSIVAITDVKGTITSVNSKFEEITGYSSEELLGQNHRILNSGFHNTEFWREMYHAVSHGNIWHGEVCNKAKDGSLYWVDTTIVPFMGEDGKPTSYIAIRTDITERKYARELLNEVLVLQKAIFDNAGVAIITTDLDGLITAFNAAAEKMLGYTADEMIGKQSPAILHKVDEVVSRAQELTGELLEVVEPGFKVFVIKSDYNLPNAHEWTYVRKDGSELPVYLNVTALYDAGGNRTGYMGIASDVSLFKAAEKQMIRAKEAAESSARVKSEFLATMSHEIRTPMNGVIGMLGLLSHSNLDETQRHQVRVASNSTNSLLALINDILDFSKVEAGKMEMEYIEFNVRDELGEFIEAIAFRAQEKGLELILDTTRLTRNSVITDPGRLRQILTNLISNAVKFTHKGQILVRVELEEVDVHYGRLRIDVSDSGIGIAPDKIDKLFDTFSQADSSTTRKYGGTGLGLAIAKKLCELMDGRIWITSVEHEGSVFHIDIGVKLGEMPTLSIPSVSVEGKTILVVDDNETNRAVVRAQLELWGMEVYEAKDPIVALDDCQIRLLQGHIPPYDVALLDMQMPNMDGADLGAELRSISQYDGMKMVMMTSLGDRNDAARFAHIGFDAFFAKPTTAKDLLNALKVLFDEKSGLEAGNPLVTKDYLGTLQKEAAEVIWPSDTRVLLVEDNPTNQIVALGILEMIGLQADIANNGIEALKSMELAPDTVPYTIILMDCQMPEMDGYAASIAIRKGRAGKIYREVPIIAMTANAMAGDREKCLMSGMSDYVSKPINLETLKAILIKWMGGKIGAVSDTALEEETQELKVWDEIDALKRMEGKKELLHKVMQSFLNESTHIMSVLDEAIATGDFLHVQLHAHSIKGLSSNVSARQVNALAKRIEFAAKNEDKRVMHEGYQTLKTAMNALCDVFKKELSYDTQSEKRKRCLDPLHIGVQLQNLKNEIQKGTFIDTDALGIFGEYADEALTVQMKRLKGHIERFDTVQALKELESIMRGLE